MQHIKKIDEQQIKDATLSNHGRILLYITSILFPHINPYLFLFYMLVHYYKIHQKQRLYVVKTATNDTLLKITVKNGDSIFDMNNTVLINRVFINNPNYAKLKIQWRDKTFERLVMVCSTNLLAKEEIGIGEVIIFNILQIINSTANHLTAKLELIPIDKIQIADEVELAVVNSPFELHNYAIDLLLKNYFSKPKILKKNDIVDVNLKLYGVEIFYSNQKSGFFTEHIYFKCLKVIYKNEPKSSEYVCVLGETSISQGANVQSFIPRLFNGSVKSPDRNTAKFEDIPTCPYGLHKNFNELERSISPFVQKKCLKLNPTFLILGNRGSGKELLISCLCKKLGIHFYKVATCDISASIYAQSETKLRNIFMNAKLYAPCILYISNFENFGKNNEGQYDERIISYFAAELRNLFTKNVHPVILICSSNDKNIPNHMKRIFLETQIIEAPKDEERSEILQWLLLYYGMGYTSNLQEVARKTSGFLFEDLKTLLYYAKSNYMKTKFTDCKEINLTEENITDAVDYMQLNYNESLGAPKIPKVQWSDVGGLNDVKDEIIKTINLPLKHPHFLKSSGLRRSGILLYGPPGTGKTLLAKAVATECNLCFLSIKGPELLNMYIGQSEENVREVFERARQASPCIIFFDELDSLAPNRGISGDSAGVMDRVVSQLLAEMDGVNDGTTIFVIGATNRPDLIDPALLRPGRFDKLLYVGPCVDVDSRISVLGALTRKFNLADDVKLEKIVEMCPGNISGADFYGICFNAWSSAVRNLITKQGEGQSDVDNLTSRDVIVTLEDFKVSLSNVKPSISLKDMKYFAKLQKELSCNT